MTRYTVIRSFADTQDRTVMFPNGYVYHVGEIFPRDGMTVEDSRIEELSSKNNSCGECFIMKVKANRTFKTQGETKVIGDVFDVTEEELGELQRLDEALVTPLEEETPKRRGRKKKGEADDEHNDGAIG